MHKHVREDSVLAQTILIIQQGKDSSVCTISKFYNRNGRVKLARNKRVSAKELKQRQFQLCQCAVLCQMYNELMVVQ